MTEHPRISLTLAILCADTTWCYVGLGVIGFFSGQHGSPLSWVTVLALLAAGKLIDQRLVSSALATSNRRALRVAGTAIVVYLAVSTGSYAEVGSVGPAWPMDLLRGRYPAVVWLGLLVAMAAATLLSRHGARIRADGMALHRLLGSFRTGVVVFAVALLVEQASGHALDAVPLLVPFFLATLTGLAISRLPTWRWRGGAWWQTVIATVGAMVLLGVGIGLTAGAYGRGGIDYLVQGGGYLLDATVWLVKTISTYLIDGALTLVDWAAGWLGDPGGSRHDDPGTAPIDSRSWLDATLAEAGPWIHAASQLLQVSVLLGILYVTYRVFRIAARLVPEPIDFQLGEQHASIRGDADAVADLRRVLNGLLPQWVTRLVPADPQALPTGPAPPSSEAGRLYLELLAAAERRGHVFVASRTPLERAPDLAAVLPGAPVEAITARFNASMYSRLPPDFDELARLRDELRRAAS